MAEDFVKQRSEGYEKQSSKATEFSDQRRSRYEIATTKKFSLIDIQQQKCLSVSEKGEGCLHEIIIKAKYNSNLVSMKQVHTFSCSNKVSLTNLYNLDVFRNCSRIR